jgi:hypothetical protein
LPQTSANEDVGQLIQDPWKTFVCDPDETGCTFNFQDDEFISLDREAVYYARAIQESSDTINANNLRCEYDENGICIKINPCYGDYKTSKTDDCLAPSEERAWSSPIFINKL